MSDSWLTHLVILPVVLPLACGTGLILVQELRHRLKFAINLASVVIMLATAVALLMLADSGGGMAVYQAGNWPPPFAISLLVDRLSALMLVLTAVIALCALTYSMLSWSRIGVHFHSLFQFMLMGLNGAFLTHDLFNLFVFFEVMLASSYGLIVHGYNLTRIRAGMQFVAINLLASLVFLVGVALVYSVTGTLNMSDLAHRLPAVSATDLPLFHLGASALAIAFLIKSAIWPLCFWLPTAYSAASPPVAAMFVLMTKVGIYAILRLWLLLFGGDNEHGFGAGMLFWAGLATIVFGAAGLLSTDVQGRLGGYAAIVSSGTLLAVIGFGQPALISAGLFYLVSSTLAVAAFMLLIELVDRSRNPVAAMLAVTVEAFDVEETPEQPVGVGIPAALAFLGLAFAGCALVITGLPPMSGFIAKFALFHALLDGSTGGLQLETVAFIVLVLVAGLVAIIALMRFGVRAFWGSSASAGRLQLWEVAPIGLLLLLCIVMTVKAGPVIGYMERTSDDLHNRGLYIEEVFAAPVAGRGGESEAR